MPCSCARCRQWMTDQVLHCVRWPATSVRLSNAAFGRPVCLLSCTGDELTVARCLRADAAHTKGGQTPCVACTQVSSSATSMQLSRSKRRALSCCASCLAPHVRELQCKSSCSWTAAELCSTASSSGQHLSGCWVHQIQDRLQQQLPLLQRKAAERLRERRIDGVHRLHRLCRCHTEPWTTAT